MLSAPMCRGLRVARFRRGLWAWLGGIFGFAFLVGDRGARFGRTCRATCWEFPLLTTGGFWENCLRRGCEGGRQVSADFANYNLWIYIRAMEATKPYKFIGFGAVEATNTCRCIWFGTMEATTRRLSIYQAWAVDATTAVIYMVRGHGGHQSL